MYTNQIKRTLLITLIQTQLLYGVIPGADTLPLIHF
ncbi:hypothetical protein J2Z48_001398 [Croceifilum oryzae]|uniref:Uncharacterized protein n=1 Tax=Croceifilum oryzae TaxID=1553429 RepID=A0AAJ1TM64_9BACL|nr:hypothetical protein [Croceifilum oryzae]